MLKRASWTALAVALAGCGAGTSLQTPETSTGAPAATAAANVSVAQTPRTLELNLLYIHGVQSLDEDRLNASASLADLDAAVQARMTEAVQRFEAAHPEVRLKVKSARANIYTATPSGLHPSSVPSPLGLDDYERGLPGEGCNSFQQGDPCTTAYEWRVRLAHEIHRLFPEGAKNLILIGHSTGARAALEVAANVGTAGIGSQDYGVQNQIAGVITLHGMIDALGSDRYQLYGPLGFIAECKLGTVLAPLVNASSPAKGFCEYAGDVSAVEASDWVFQHKHALELVSHGICGPSIWSGFSDASLPYGAQASRDAPGLDMTPVAGETWSAVHGVKYGNFCHSDVADGSRPDHVLAVNAATDQIFTWLFDNERRVLDTGMVQTDRAIRYDETTPVFPVGDLPETQPGVPDLLQVVGNCSHPGWFDGDDHPVDPSELDLQPGTDGLASFFWTQTHDRINAHAATFWWKTLTERHGGVVPQLPTE